MERNLDEPPAGEKPVRRKTARAGLLARARRSIRSTFRRASRNDHLHLFSSPANAGRLRSAMQKSLSGEGKPFTPEELRAELGLGEE